MATASPPSRSRPKARSVSLWRRPLLVGVCFALGYGLTQRLLDLRLPALVSWGQSFDVRDRPGTSLESLRLRFGSEPQALRGQLEQPDPDPLSKPQPDPADDSAALAMPDAAPAASADAVTPTAPVLPAAPATEAPPAPRQP